MRPQIKTVAVGGGGVSAGVGDIGVSVVFPGPQSVQDAGHDPDQRFVRCVRCDVRSGVGQRGDRGRVLCALGRGRRADASRPTSPCAAGAYAGVDDGVVLVVIVRLEGYALELIDRHSLGD